MRGTCVERACWFIVSLSTLQWKATVLCTSKSMSIGFMGSLQRRVPVKCLLPPSRAHARHWGSRSAPPACPPGRAHSQTCRAALPRSCPSFPSSFDWFKPWCRQPMEPGAGWAPSLSSGDTVSRNSSVPRKGEEIPESFLIWSRQRQREEGAGKWDSEKPGQLLGPGWSPGYLSLCEHLQRRVISTPSFVWQ